MVKIAPTLSDNGVRRTLPGALAIACAMILGGGGTPAPLAEMAVQLVLAALFCVWLVWFPGVPRRQLRTALALAGLLLVVPLLQLIPLPPALWQALPGRDLERSALDLVGAADSWQPLSMAPARTFGSLLALLPPAIVLVLTGSAREGGRSLIVGMIAGVSLLAIMVGVGQAAGGENNPLRFYVVDAGYLNGFQANHNSSADVLLIGMIASAVTVQELRGRRKMLLSDRLAAILVLTVAAVLSLGVVLTASRAGTALLPVAWVTVFCATRGLWPISRQGLTFGIGGLFLALGTAAFLLRDNSVLRAVVSRYDFTGELRPQIWADSLYAARTYFPVGAGLGAFIPVFLAAERLEAVDMTVPNRAHNDYLELVIEAGVLGLLVLAVLATMLARLALAQLRDQSPTIRRQAIFALGTFTIVALHSQVDYPLRSMSLACIAAAAAGLLVPVARGLRGANV
jgi:O-antigen ligase